MRPRRKLFSTRSVFSQKPLDLFGGCLLLLGVLTAACGQASPQGIDDLGAKPGYTVLSIYPQNPEVQTGGSIQFRLRNQWDEPVDGPVNWTATGGTITRNGLYKAGYRAGSFQVDAKLYGGTASQRVTVVTSSAPRSPSPSDPDPEEPEPSDPEDPEPSDPEPPPSEEPEDPTPGSVIFADGFESGDFSVWSTDATPGDSRWSGMGGGGAHLGDGYITSEQVHSGRLAWKAMIDPSWQSYDDGLPQKSSVARWKSMQGISEFYISAWYYIPTNYPPVSSLIMQAKASGPSFAPVAFRMREDRELIVRSAIEGGTLYSTGVKAPLGRWFNLVGRFVIADSGLVELWLDGRKIASVRTDTKDSSYAYPGVGNYIRGSQYPVKCHIYIDDVKITTAAP